MIKILFNQILASTIHRQIKKRSKFRIKKWVKITDESRGTHNINSRIKFETTKLRSLLCDYGDAYILSKGTISLVGQGVDTQAIKTDRNNK